MVSPFVTEDREARTSGLFGSVKTMTQTNSSQYQLAEDSIKLLESAIVTNLEMTPEERIEAHENARQLMMDLQAAGKVLRAAAMTSISY